VVELNFHKTLYAAGGNFKLDINCAFNQGDFITIYGPSGAGKTTMLRIIAGLLNPDSGSIKIGDLQWLDTNTSINLNPQKRSVGLVFQDYALFPNMTVKENIHYAVATNKNESTTNDIIQLMELESLLNRKPETLSGGQKQRVALARSLATMPDILLLDEPMAALDIEMRSIIQDYLLKVHKEFNLTTILVSHDIAEIFKMANYVVKIEDGQIVKQGKPVDVFLNNKAEDSFQFMGEILSITQDAGSYKLTILIGQQLVKLEAEEAEVKNFTAGDKVLVTADDFKPNIQKVS